MNLGKVLISEELLLKWLRLEGGALCHVEFNARLGVIECVIEHPEMPVVSEGSLIPEVRLSHAATFNERGDLITVKRGSIIAIGD